MSLPASADVVLAQRCLLADEGCVEICLEQSADGLSYRLAYLRGGACLLRYENAGPREHLRVLRGRAAPYAFRSVEQLRYDFERDLEAL